MEKKNKKKLFAIIGGSVLAFVLTIALSVSITLAYFGGVANGKLENVSLGGSVAVGADLAMTGATGKVVPGQTINVKMEASVTSTSTQKAAAVLLVKGTVTPVESSGWDVVEGYTLDGYTIYAYGTEEALTVISADKTTPAKVTFNGTQTVSTSLDNDDADQVVDAVTVEAKLIVIQNGEVKDNDTTQYSFEQLVGIFQQVGSVTFTEV